MRTLIDRYINQNSSRSLIKRIARNCDRFLKHFWNDSNWDFSTNGEASVLNALSGNSPGRRAIILDVGANRGDWAKMVISRFPAVDLHAFEIVPDTFQRLSESLRDAPGENQKIHLNNFGLSDRSGSIEVSYLPDVDNGSSINPLPHGVRTETRLAEIRSGDDYLNQMTIREIDLLKVDTEGHDLFVLRGFRGALENRLIKCIQFEYGQICIPPKVFLGDFYSLLAPHGYQIGRLFPDGVAFKPYSAFHDEHFRSGNYIAVRNSEEALVSTLRRP